MNFLFKLFNKTQIKMKDVRILIALHSFYATIEKKDIERMKRLQAEINVVCDKMVGAIVTPQIEQIKENKEQHKSATPPPPVNKTIQPEKKEEIKTKPQEEKKEPVKTEKQAEVKPKEEVNESLINVVPFYPCKVNSNGKFAKDVNVESLRSFKAWVDEDAAKAAKGEDKYPTVDFLDMVLDEAWTMICKGESNKVVLEMCRKELGKFYPELKVDSDWYSKLVNPIRVTVGLIKKSFGYKIDDATVVVTRPTEEKMTLEIKTDCTVTKPVKAEEAPVKEPEKKEMKTVQKGPAKKEDDEEAQETAETAAEETGEEENNNESGTEEETTERDTTNPPSVNPFSEFNDLESLIFEKYMEAGKLAANMKDEASKKAIQTEKREEARMLIQSNFEDEPWTDNTSDGKWNPKLLLYYNNIVREISVNRANWGK